MPKRCASSCLSAWSDQPATCSLGRRISSTEMPARFCRCQLLVHAAGFARFLGDKAGDVPLANHGKVHLLGEGTLHRNQVCGRDAQRQTAFHHIGKRQHPRVKPLGKALDLPVGRQLLAAGGQQDVPFDLLQQMGCLLGVLCHQKVWVALQLILSLLAFPQTAVERDVGLGAGGGNILRHHRGIGVGGVDDQVKAFLLYRQLLHLLPVHPSGVDGQIRLRADERFPVLGGNAGGDLHLAAC